MIEEKSNESWEIYISNLSLIVCSFFHDAVLKVLVTKLMDSI
jgi:hypothetical protein